MNKPRDYANIRAWWLRQAEDAFNQLVAEWSNRDAEVRAAGKAGLKELDTWCTVCGRRQFDTPSGVSCPEGHGGAHGTDDARSARNIRRTYSTTNG